MKTHTSVSVFGFVLVGCAQQSDAAIGFECMWWHWTWKSEDYGLCVCFFCGCI